MDDYAMGIFLATRRKILSIEPDGVACLCVALTNVLFDDGGNAMSNKEMPEIFPAFGAAYDGKHFRLGNLVEGENGSSTEITACWWYPSEDKNPRIAMIDFLVGR